MTGKRKPVNVVKQIRRAIDLCLSLFPWAQHRKHKSAVKLHTLMDLKGSIPTYIRITSGAVHETTVFRTLPLEPSKRT